jgi:hypothetical protein
MPTMTYTPLANLTLGSSAASVTFSSIPATYRDLIVVLNIRSTHSGDEDYALMRFNGDTGSNYSYVFMNGSGAAATSGTASSSTFINDSNFAANSATANVFTPAVINIQDYSATDKHKTTISRSNSTTASGQVSATAGRWANTAAITSVAFTCFQSGASYASGSTFSLYGVIA